MFLRNVGISIQVHTELQPIRPTSISLKMTTVETCRCGKQKKLILVVLIDMPGVS
jgi:hypothetical protein